LFYLFEDFGLDTDRRELYRGATPVPVEPKVFDLLAYVIQNRDRVVSKDDLIAAIWNGRIVSESALTTCINAARNAIGDSGEAQRLIKTLPRKGVRFVGSVREQEGNPPAAVATDAASGRSRPSLALPDKPTVAVLPFTNMSGDPEQEYFSDGITEDIITDLSKVSALNVLSRSTTFTFKGQAVEIGQIAQRLKVSYVIEGSVRKAGGRVRITAQLIDASKDSHIWGERYDRELNDIFALQDEIAQTIVAALKIRLLPEDREAIESRSTKDPKAYQLYLLARFYRLQYHPRTIRIALNFCRRALEVDPDYARAWALAAICESCLFLLGGSEDPGLSSAEKALSLDPTLAEAHAAKGFALWALGESALAMAAHEESLRLAPDSYDVRACVAHTNLMLGNYETAIEHYERAAQLLEADYFCIGASAACHFALGHHEECASTARRAMARIEREIALRPDNQDALACGASTLGYLGETERAKEWAMRALAIESDDDMRGNYNLACALAQSDEPEQALNQLEKYAEKMPPVRLAWVKRDADLAPLRNHPRYKALVARAEARYSAFQAEKAAKAKRDLN
jgi:adenylate cyclase